MFWIIGTILSITMGAMVSLMVVANLETKWRGVIGFIVAFVIGYAVTGLLMVEEEVDAKNWNNGYCPTCEEHWVPNGVAKSRNGPTTHYYYCPECYKEITQH